MTDLFSLKKQLYQACLDLITERIENARKALQAAREAGNEETKSSAGDKYETGRAMMQQEQEKFQVQLSQAMELQHALKLLSPDRRCEKAEPGSLVITSQGKYFIAIGAGKVTLNGEIFYAVSAASPVGRLLLGRKPGEEASFQGKIFRITQIF